MNDYRCETCIRFPTCIFRKDSDSERIIREFLGEDAFSVSKFGQSYLNFAFSCSNFKKVGKEND